jgi:FKBP-type peptidyl-prolyl cis-trans isomerase FkpA
MFRSVPFFVLLFVALGAGPAAQTSPPGVSTEPPAAAVAALTDEQKVIYALGLMMQRSLRQFDLSPEELAIVARALSDGAAGRPLVDLKEWGPQVEQLAAARHTRVVRREKAAAVAYLAEAATELAAVRMPSGLVYRDLAVGAGPSPGPRDTVRVHYRGTLIDGTVFDSSYERNEAVAFRLGEVVPCWTEGVQRMKVGGKARLVCPSELAYGDAGSQGIPGGAALVFEVELVGIVSLPVR